MTLPFTKSRPALIAEAARGRYFSFALCCFCTLANVLLIFISPQITRFAIDSVLTGRSSELAPFFDWLAGRFPGAPTAQKYLAVCAGLMVCTTALSCFFTFRRRYRGMEISEHIAQTLRNSLYGHIQHLPFEWHVKCQTGDIIQRCTSDVDTLRNFFQNHFIELLRTVAVFMTALCLMLAMDPFMTGISLLLIPLVLLFSIFYFKKIGKEFARADAEEGRLQACMQENFTGVRVVRAFGRERFEIDRFSEVNRSYTDIWIKIGKLLGNFWGAGDVIAALQLTLIIGIGILRASQGLLTPGTFWTFFTYCNMMIWPVRQLGRIVAELSKSAVSAGRIQEILSAVPETEQTETLRPVIKGEIRYENVTFAYGNAEPVLKDVSFTLKPGKTLAILGGTGSGKSTLVHLLARLYDVPENCGRITVDGTDIRLIDRAHLRRNIGLVLQEPFLFSKTLRENIAATRPGARLEDLRRAAVIADVDGAIQTFTDGYETLVGERGVTLSGGQKQRVAMARMLVSQAPVMVFDDSLSAVDTETDARIRAALKKETKDAAVIIISHRVSTLMQCDEILVLRDGTVEELGSHAELMKRDGSYKRIFDLQGSMAEEA